MYVYNYLTKSIPDTTLSPLPLHPRAKEQLKLLHKGSFKIQTVQAVPCNLLRIFSTIESSQLVIYILPFSWLRLLPLHPCCRHYTTPHHATLQDHDIHNTSALLLCIYLRCGRMHIIAPLLRSRPFHQCNSKCSSFCCKIPSFFVSKALL